MGLKIEASRAARRQRCDNGEGGGHQQPRDCTHLITALMGVSKSSLEVESAVQVASLFRCGCRALNKSRRFCSASMYWSATRQQRLIGRLRPPFDGRD